MRSFIFGEGQEAKTPAQLARMRELADAMAAQNGRAPQNVGEGLQSIGNAILYRSLMGKVGAGEKAGQNRASAAFNNIAGAMAGQSAFPTAPGSAKPSSGAPASIVRPDDPNLPSRLDFARADARSAASSGLPSSFLSAVDSAEGGGDYDTLYGFAQRDGGRFAGTRISEMPIKDAIAFSDPNGPYAQTVKGQIGHVATPMGRHQIVGTTLRNAVAEMGLDPNTPFNAQTQDAIAAHLARKRIASADTMGGKIAGLRSEWAGFKNVPDAQMVQIVTDLEAGGSMPSATAPAPAPAPVQVASLDPSAGVAEALRPMPEEYANSGMSPETWAKMNAPNGAVPAPAAPQAAVPAPVAQPQGQQQIAQALAQQQNQPQGQDLSQIPVTAGGTGGAITRDAQGGPSLQMLMETANEPFLNDSQRGIVNALLEQQMQNSDPMRQLQIQKLQQELNATPERKTVTINGRLVDAQTGQEIANFPEEPKKPEDPTNVREYKFYVDQEKMDGREPLPFNEWQLQSKRAGATVINNGSNTSEFVKKSDEAAAKRMDEIVTAGQTAPQTMADMQQLIDLGAQIGTGKEAQIKAFIGPYAQALGIDVGNMDEIQAYEAITSRLAPQMRAVGSGSSSDRDVSMFLQSLPNLRNLQGGNEIIANTMKAVAQNKINAAEIASKAQRGEISWQDADKQIRELPNPYELFKTFQKETETSKGGKVPEGMDPADWEFMTPEERRLFQ